ncbi:MAG TPA: hypothetical protein VGE31_02050 [Candidatus Paceibacterota bacterium]
MKTKLFKSFGVSDLEIQINDWLTNLPREQRSIEITDILFSPHSPQNPEQKFALLFLRNADFICTQRVKLIDSGVHTPEEINQEVDDWLHSSGVENMSIKQIVVDGDASHPRIYSVIIYPV